MPFRKEITNHLGHSLHAIALCNAAELAGGMMTDASIPAGARWIPQRHDCEYLGWQTDIRAVADGSAIDWQTAGDKIVPVEIFDAESRSSPPHHHSQ